MNKKAILLIVLSLGIMAFLSGCTTLDSFKEAFFLGDENKDDTIRIGVLEPQSGDDKEYGKLEIEGIELAHEVYGEVLDKKVELIYADTQSSMYSVDSAVTDLISKNPAVVLGCYGDAMALEASSILRPAKIPAIGITTVNPLVTGGNDYYFRVAFSEESQGTALANFIHDELKFDSVGIIRLKGEDATSEMVTQFTRRFTKLTDNKDCIAANVSLDQTNLNTKENLEKISKSGVKVVFMPTSLKIAENFFEKANAMNMDRVLFIGPHNWHNEELLKICQKYPKLKIAVLSDVLSEVKTESAGEATKRHQQFLELYHSKYGDTEPPRETALAFDAYMIAVRAIKEAGSTDHEAVREALANTKDYMGVSGAISYNKKGEPHKLITVDLVKDNRFVSIYTMNQKHDSADKDKEVKEKKEKKETKEKKTTKNSKKTEKKGEK